MITSSYFKVYHFQKVSGKSVLEGNGSPTQPTLYKQRSGLPTAFQDMNKNCETGLTVFFYPKKTRRSNRLQMTVKRQ